MLELEERLAIVCPACGNKSVADDVCGTCRCVKSQYHIRQPWLIPRKNHGALNLQGVGGPQSTVGVMVPGEAGSEDGKPGHVDRSHRAPQEIIGIVAEVFAIADPHQIAPENTPTPVSVPSMPRRDAPGVAKVGVPKKTKKASPQTNLF